MRSVFAGVHSPAWVLAAALFCGFFLNLGGAPLFDRDEGAFSEATREMFDRGDFVSPYLNGQPRFDKPILTYWCQAASLAALGPREEAFRLPSAVFATLWVLAVVGFAAPRLGRDAAMLAGTLMATSVGIVVIGRAAIADALLNCLLALAMFDAYRWSEEPRRGPHLRFFLWMGLGALAKGPVAILVPGAITLLYFGARHRLRDWLKLMCFPAGILVFLIVALPWYVAQYCSEGDAFLRGFFLTHNVGRFLSPMDGHGGAVFYYLLAVPLVALPHTSLLLRVLPRVRAWRRDPLDSFCWTWALFVLAFFTLSATKLPHYAFLGITPLFLLMARYRQDLRSRALALAPAVLLLGLIGALPWLLRVARTGVQDPYVGAWLDYARSAFGAGYVFAVAAAAVVVLALAFIQRLRPWQALGLAGVTLGLLFPLIVFPAIGEAVQGPVRAAALRSREMTVPVVSWDLNHPSISVYRDAATPDRPPRPGEACLTKLTHVRELSGCTIVFQRGGIVLVMMPAAAR